MKYQLPILYKKLLILFIVLGPIVWLMFTEDGQRRTDTVVLWLFGEDEIKLDLNSLAAQYTEDDIRKVYPELSWQCQAYTSSYGERLCASRIGVFNGIPAKYITTFFRVGQLSALKLHYRANNHAQFQSQLRYQLGKPDDEPRAVVTPVDPETVLQWRTPYGLVVMKKVLVGDEEASIFWLSSKLLAD